MGRKLFDQITELTGLPQHIIKPELENFIITSGYNLEDLTPDLLKRLLLELLEQTFATPITVPQKDKTH